MNTQVLWSVKLFATSGAVPTLLLLVKAVDVPSQALHACKLKSTALNLDLGH